MEKILLGHGSGGRIMHQLIREYFAPEFDLKELNDSAVIDLGYDGNKFKLAFTTDSYVVSPIFFPGGNIGDLAVNGTVNDLAMVGAMPLYLSAGFIIEEGFPMTDLKTILSSMSEAAKIAGVRIVAGDTKVVDKGKGDGIFINTSGIGIVPEEISLSSKNIKAGDKVIVSGLIGNHGIAVLAERNGLSFEPPILSDTAPLNGLVGLMLNVSGEIKMMRDPTRGGVATTLKEIAGDSGLCITINENLLPISSAVIGACELLGLDPLYIANEGTLIAIVSSDSAEPLIERIREHPYGRNAAIVGEVSDNNPRTNGMVLLKTAIGGTRIIDMLSGEQLPRIC
jgi:hydrogenase expression/formation protein HypE